MNLKSILAGCVLSFSIAAFGQTNSAEATNTATQNALLQIQEQLHAAQLAIADSQSRADVAAATNVAVLTARIQALEQSLVAQRANDVEAARKTQELTLLIAGTFGLAGLSVILLMFYFQWRGFSHLAQVSAQHAAAMQQSRALPMVEAVHQLAAPGRLAIEGSNGKLLDTVERLEKRVVEMELAARAQLTHTATASTIKKNGSSPKDTVTNLLADGQTLLNANQAENALKLFEQALSIDPNSAEALVKKGGALEKLNRMDEAVASYDNAIRLNDSLTIAYLQKGGLFSRMARYDEALLCYEQALLTQDKLPAQKIS